MDCNRVGNGVCIWRDVRRLILHSQFQRSQGRRILLPFLLTVSIFNQTLEGTAPNFFFDFISSRAASTLPHVFHKSTPLYHAVFAVVNHTFPKLIFPIFEYLKPRVKLSNRFVSKLEQIRIEKWKMVVRSELPAMFRPAVLPIVFALSSCSTLILRSSAGLKKFAASPAALDIRISRLQEFINNNPVVRRNAGTLRKFNVRNYPKSGNHGIG